MRLNLRRMFLLLMIAVTAGTLRAQLQFGAVLDESFEEGSIPEGWVTEHVKGSQEWMVERGGSHPDGAYDGEWRLAWRNTTGVTQGNVTRLVLPEADVTTLFQPMLCIAFAQDKWTNDFDTLRVVYRVDAESAWQTLRTYDHYVSYWTLDTIFLENVSPTYQIAFEASDNLGHGIVIDKVEIRSKPYCTQPYNVQADSIKNNMVTLKWAAGIDAVNYRICVSREVLSQEQLASPDFKSDVFDSLVPGDVKEFTVSGLEQGMSYNAYIRSLCETESSEWSDVLAFETTNLVPVPYYETFNMEYTGEPSQSPIWRYGSSIEEYMVPFINTKSSTSLMKRWSRDTTTCLVFSSKNQDASNIPENEYAYAATPELDVLDVSKLTVRFWSRTEYNTQSDINRIIVGVMTNPEDYNTFVPVDTVKLADKMTFEEFIVPLDTYKGIGKYVAFASDFDVTNQFYIDDVSITETPDLRQEKNFKISIPAADRIVMSWDRHGATSGDVIISSSPIETPDAVPADQIVTFTSDSYTYTAEAGKEYYIRVRNSAGDRHGEWSEERKVRTPLRYAETDLPVTLGFEINTSDKSSYYYPHSYTSSSSSYRVPIYCLTLGEILCDDQIYAKSISSGRTKYELMFAVDRPYESAYAVFPELPGDITTLRASFWSKSQNSNPVTFEAGIMSDVNDTASFVPLDTITAPIKDDGYEKFYVPFVAYRGEGKFFAVRVKDYDMTDNVEDISAYIDDLTFEPIPECKEATNVAVTPGSSSAEFTWDANGADEWHLRVYDEDIPYDSLSSATFVHDYVYDMPSDSNHVTVSGLKGNVNTYYYTVQTVCGGAESDWSAPKAFETECYEKNPLPYVQNFDEYTTGSKAAFQIPCMYTVTVKNGTSYYPYLYTSRKLNGKASLYFNPATDAESPQYLILPEMEKPLSEIQLEMHVYATAASALEIGTVENTTGGLSTYDSVTTIYVTTLKEWQEVAVLFSGCSPDGRNIVLRTPDVGGAAINVDSLVVKEKDACAWVQAPAVKDTKYNSATIEWRGDTETQWDMAVTTAEMSEEELDAVMTSDGREDVAFRGTVGENPYTITGLTPSKQYYCYVRANCGEGLTGRWSTACGFMTACEFLEVGELGTETFESYGSGGGKYPTCWAVGNMDGATSATYVPFITSGGTENGQRALKIQSDPGEDANGAYIASPMLDIDDISTLQVHFFAEIDDSYLTDAYQKQLIAGVATDLSDYASFEPVDTIDGYFGGKYYTVPLDRYDGDYNEKYGQYVVFISRFEKKNHILIDDIWFDTIPECRQPYDVSFSEIETNSVRISWRGDYTPYTVKVSPRMLTAEELAASVESDGILTYNTNNEFVVAEGLDSVTTYYVYLKGGCEDGGESDWSDPYIVETECPEVYGLPYVQDFDNVTIMSDCWIGFYTESGSEQEYPSLSTVSSYVHGGKGQSWKFNTTKNNERTYAVAPAFDVDNVADCQVIFFAATTGTTYVSSVIVGVVSDISSNEKIIETFEPVDTATINKETGFHKFNISMRGYKGNGRYIALRTDAGANNDYTCAIYIDDLQIVERPECAVPDFFSFVSASDSSVVIEFTDYAEASEWEVKYGNKGFIPDESGTTVSFTKTTDTVRGLDDATEYDLYIRAVCDRDKQNYSAWTGPLTVKTMPTPVDTFPYINGFDDEKETMAWTFVNDTNAWCIGTAYPYDEGGMSMYVSHDHGQSAVIVANNAKYKSYSFAYRPIELKTGEYHFEFDWIGKGRPYYEFMRVGLLPVEATFGSDEGSIFLNGEEIGDIASIYSEIDPQYYISLEGVDDKGETILEMNGAEEWTHQYISHIVTEDKAGVYNLVVFWYNSTDYSNDKVAPSMVIDNLKIDYIACASPAAVTLNDVSDTSAIISWQPVGEPLSYDIFVTDNSTLTGTDNAEAGDTVFYVEGVKSLTAMVEKLAPQTKYNAFVRSVCADGAGPWSTPLSFETMCAPKEPGDTISFEEEEGYYVFFNNDRYEYWMTSCLVRLHPTLDLAGTWLDNNNTNAGVVRGGSTDTKYSHGKGLYSLYISSSSEKNKGGCVVMPAFNARLDTMQLTFWMRPFTAEMDAGGTVSGSSLGTAKTITVGTLTAPNDLSTFKAVDTLTYPYSADYFTSDLDVRDDPSGNEYWVKFSVPLENAEGKYLAFLNSGYDGVSNGIYIDDVVLEKIAPEYQPYSAVISDVEKSSAKFTWAADGGDRWIVQLSTQSNMSDTVLIDTVTDKSYEFNDVMPGTDYYASVRTVTDENGVVSDPVMNQFLTPYGLCFEENLNSAVIQPQHWMRATNSAEGVFAGNDFNVTPPTSTTTGWVYNNGQSGMPDGHQMLGALGGADRHAWFITPVIQLDDSAYYTLTFDLALTDADTSDPMTWDNYGSQEKTFMAVVSADAGNTWNEDDATVWCNREGEYDYLFDSIPYNGRSYTVDLSAYRGKQIKIGFYAGSVWDNAPVDLHLDNIRVNAAVEANYSVGLCETEDFRGYGLDLVDGDLSLGGDNVFEDFRLAASADVPDTMQTVTITVEPLGEYPVYGTICRGRRYTEDGFDASAAGEYKKKIRREGMCDSVVVLTLEVIDPAESLTIDSICEGGEYAWGDTVYRRPGTYHDTLQMSGLECDSIATLVLKVIPLEVHHAQMTVCYGEHYTWGDTTLTTTGIYRRRFETTGCDSIVELDFTVRPDLRRTYREVICSGESFTGYGFKDVFTPGEHTLPITTDDGCDSTVTLVLTVIESDTTYVSDTVTTDELPYEYLDLYYGEDTRPGTYRDTITAEAGDGGECRTVIVHTLTVEATTWWGGTEADGRGLVIAPNPVEVGGTVTLGIELTAAERTGASVSVYSTAGAMVKSMAVPEDGDITMTCWFSPGVYMVRLTTGTGVQYHGKVIVR